MLNSAARSDKSFFVSSDYPAVTPSEASLTTKQKAELASDLAIAQFVASGGIIEQLPTRAG
jgi:hypothetical protein